MKIGKACAIFLQIESDKFTYKCKTETVTVTDEPKRTLEVHPCDFTDGECPHGSDIAWWLAQRCQENLFLQIRS